jgi:ribosomal RNA assembly protein
MEDEILMNGKKAKEIVRQKKLLEKIKQHGVTLEFEENMVYINGSSALEVLSVKNVVNAFNRGFDSAISSLLLDDDYDLVVISLRDFSNSEKRAMQLKGRVIGTRGMIKQRLMKETGCYINVYGKTISIIGQIQNLSIAQSAIEMILNGAKHDNVFSMINKRKVEVYLNGNR